MRFYRTSERQDFHTDGADIIGLLCLHRAQQRRREPHRQLAAPSTTRSSRRRPDLLEVLYDRCTGTATTSSPRARSRSSRCPSSPTSTATPRVFYIGWYIRDAQRHPEVPRLTDAQVEAMDLLESIANDPAFHLEMDFQPGDVQLLNNAGILHAREAYEDDDDPAERRHLLRLWLAAHHFASVEELPPRRHPPPGHRL